MIKKIILFSLVCFHFTFPQSGTSTGLSFLKIGPSARSISLADFGTIDSDISAVYYNPASINLLESPGIMFTHQMWIQDVYSEILGANFSFLGLPFFVGVNTTKIKGFEARTLPTDTPDATFNVNYFYGNLSTGFSLYENLEFGFTIKYLYESLLSDDASGTGYDLGLIYTDVIQNLAVGASIRNMGSMQKLRNEKTELPSDFILNTSYYFEFPEISVDLKPVLGLQKYFDLDDIHFHAAAEAAYDSQFFLRLGYVTGYEAKGISAGAGFYWEGFNIDYAFTPFSYGIGNANTFSIAYSF